MHIKIRKAETGDIAGITGLLLQVAGVHSEGRPDLFKAGCVKYGPDELKSIINNPDTPVLVAMDEGGRVLGHAFCAYKRTSETQVLKDRLSLYIDDVCVDEAHRGRRIGSALLGAALDMARSAGCYNATLNVWSFNSGAKSFYKTAGFAEQRTTMEKIL